MRVRGSKGQVLILTVILMAVGTMVLTPLLSQLSTTLRWGGNELDQRMKVYAIEAATSQVIADLIRGADGVATTYTTTEPHTGGSFATFTITTAYTPPSVTVNGLTPTVSLALPTGSQAKPTTQQSYSDPGVTHPGLFTVAAGDGYLMRLYNVKAGTLQVNWAYSPAGSAEIKIWAGIPASSGVPIPAGGRTGSISVYPVLDSASVASGATFVRNSPRILDPATDGSGGVYTILFFNKANTTKTTAAFVGSGGASHTWIFAKAHKDYKITASVGGVSVNTYVRQVPGFMEPPAVVSAGGNSFTYTFSASNISFITNEVFAYTWNSP
jgi:hypothetical protein